MRSELKKMMEADVQGHCLIMSVAVNKRMLWSRGRKIMNNSRQRSRMTLKRCIVITTKQPWPRINRRSEQSTLESQTADFEQQSDQSTCERHVVVSWTTRV